MLAMGATARYLVAGCGYVGRRLARALLPRGPVVGLTRSEASAAELDALCLSRIARFKRPKDYVFVDGLPKNNYGKILKTELRAMDAKKVGRR